MKIAAKQVDARAADAARALWERELVAELGCAVDVRWTRARSQVVRMRRERRRGAARIELALADFFRAAPPDVRSAVAAWVRSGRRAKKACRALDEWADAQLDALPERAVDPRRLRARGRVHDLAELARELHDEGHLAGLLAPERTPPLTYGRAAGSRARRSLRLGSCSPRGNLIRIHPVLDQPAVPRRFVRAIVFHELLHVAFPTARDAAGRRAHHGPHFRRAERAFADDAFAREWERAHIDALIHSARTGRPLAARAARREGARNSARGVLRLVQGLLFGARETAR
ncbi:MAG: hypothetical protein EPO68_08020 [Planctomycetota bacterium]|nr:MAG: hypothetical protein EPO68_08020 [Planctomycetota bacterium]